MSSSARDRGLVGRKNIAVWDERRNTSRVVPPPPHALADARRALDRLRDDDPELVSWIEAGHPRLSHDEHVRRFGGPYTASGRARGRGRSA